jgi:hypothetical protein
MKFRRIKSVKSLDNISKGFGNTQLQGNIFHDVRTLTRGKEKGYKWYRDTVRMIAQKSDIYSTLASLDDTIIPQGGNLYLFEYNATWARKLKYYDEFPLVYMLQGGLNFFGANLHYLNPAKRAEVLDSILNDRTPRIPKQCFHNYVHEGLETPLFEINREDWKTAIFIPNETFVTRRRGLYQRVSKSFVWGDSER